MRKSIITPLASALASSPGDKDPNSAAFALQVDHILQLTWVGLGKDKDEFSKYLDYVKQYEIWRRVNPPFKSYDEYIKDRTGCASDVVIPMYENRCNTQTAAHANNAKPMAGVGRPTNKGYNYNLLESRGTSTPYLTTRIARDRPDILERMKAGEYRSVRAAAIDAGIIAPDKSRRYQLPTDPDQAGRYMSSRVDSDWLIKFCEAFTANSSQSKAPAE